MDRAGRFSLGLILGLLLVVLLVFLVLESWFLYKNGNGQVVQNDKVVLGKCCLVQAVECCPVKKSAVKASQKKPKPKPKATAKPAPKAIPQAVVVEEIIPRAVVMEKSIPTAIPQSGPASLLDGVDPDFGKTTVQSMEDRGVEPTVRRKRYVFRQSPPLNYGGVYGGCPYLYGCEYGSTYPPQVTYGQPYIPPPQTVFIPAPPVIVPAPSVVTPAGMYGK